MKNSISIKPAFVFVERHQLTIAQSGGAAVASIALSTDVVVDLEVTNQKLLEKRISDLLDQTQIEPKLAIVIMAESTTFSKDLPGGMPKEGDPALTDFLHLVPFENTLMKVFPTSAGSRAVAMNRDLIVPILMTLEGLGFPIVAISPAFSLGVDLTKTGFTKEVVPQAEAKINIFLAYNYFSYEEIKDKLNPPKPFLSVKIDAKLIVMVVIFAVLLLILGALLQVQRG
jgi:hypothetical protein